MVWVALVGPEIEEHLSPGKVIESVTVTCDWAEASLLEGVIPVPVVAGTYPTTEP